MNQIIDIEEAANKSLDEKLKKLMDKEDTEFKPNESFEDRWAKGIPLEDARTHLLKTVRNL
jgi:hypothetical protein